MKFHRNLLLNKYENNMKFIFYNYVFHSYITLNCKERQ